MIGVFLREANEWLIGIQNIDGGWGNHEGDESTLLNTAEALLTLTLLDEPAHSVVVKNGLHYLISSLRKEPTPYPRSARDYAWAGLCLQKIYGYEHPEARHIAEWLVRNQGKLGYWDDEDHYSTAIALRFLHMQRTKYRETIERALKWLAQGFNGKGWGSRPKHKTSVGVTAHVALSFVEASSPLPDVDAIRGYLLESIRHPNFEVMDSLIVRGGKTFFRHSVLPWAIIALLALGEPPLSKGIIEAVGRLLMLYNLKSGGWSPIKHEVPRTWATLAAVAALKDYESKVGREKLESIAESVYPTLSSSARLETWAVVDQLHNVASGPFKSFLEAQESLQNLKTKGVRGLAVSSYWRTVELEE